MPLRWTPTILTAVGLALMGIYLSLPDGKPRELLGLFAILFLSLSLGWSISGACHRLSLRRYLKGEREAWSRMDDLYDGKGSGPW